MTILKLFNQIASRIECLCWYHWHLHEWRISLWCNSQK